MPRASGRRGGPLGSALLSALVCLHAARGTAAADPAPGAAPPRLALQTAVERAQTRHPSVAVAAATLRRAEALLKEARAGAMPTLAGNASYLHLDHDRTLTSGDQKRIIAGQDQLSANLTLTVPLVAPLAWGGKWAAEDGATLAGASARDVRRTMGIAAARAYLAVVAQHRVVAAVESARDTSRAHHDYEKTRLAGGIGRSIDEVRAAQELAGNESQAETVRAALARAQEALGVLTGEDGPVDSEDDVRLGEPPSLPQALSGAHADRTDVALAAKRVEVARNRRGELWTYYAPYLAAVGQPFYQNPPSLVQPLLGWQAQLVLALPLWDGGLRDGVQREREAAIEEARATLEGAVRQAESEVRTALAVMLRADAALVAARQAADLARRAVELAALAYQAGATGNLEVIDAQRRARDAEIAAAVTEDAARQARLDLLVASGRFPG